MKLIENLPIVILVIGALAFIWNNRNSDLLTRPQPFEHRSPTVNYFPSVIAH